MPTRCDHRHNPSRGPTWHQRKRCCGRCGHKKNPPVPTDMGAADAPAPRMGPSKTIPSTANASGCILNANPFVRKVMGGGSAASVSQRDQPEGQIQCPLAQHLRFRGARSSLWNNSAHWKREAAILSIVHNGWFYAIELDLSAPARVAFRAEINASGGFPNEPAGPGATQ